MIPRTPYQIHSNPPCNEDMIWVVTKQMLGDSSSKDCDDLLLRSNQHTHTVESIWKKHILLHNAKGQ